MPRTTYTAEIVSDSGSMADIRLHINGKTWHLWGRNGNDRETSLANSIESDALPVLIGSGLGHCLKLLTDRGIPTAVVDRENAILQLTGVKSPSTTPDSVLWLDTPDPQETLNALASWQKQHGHKRLVPLVMPLYPRLDREYYGTLAHALKNAETTDFWSQAQYPKFQSAKPRILFFDSDYFLCNEIRSTLERLEIEYRTLKIEDRETGSTEFIKNLLQSTINFKPDFALTVNHFGLDRAGKLAELLNDLNLPLASWFVDNPHLIIYDYDHPGTDNTVVFTFDAGNLDEMRTKKFRHVHYLPLATDPHRFRPGLPEGPDNWASDVSFVGTSMVKPVADSLGAAQLPPDMADSFESVAKTFGESGETNVARYLETARPDWATIFKKLPTRENRLALESLLTWEATRQYRLACVRASLPAAPLIVGDDGWDDLLDTEENWRRLDRVDYYADLPRFYPMSGISLNCTSRQMIGAVNQRVFDVPACGGFVLTDHREQMDDLFDMGTEAIVYRSPDEIPSLIERFLADSDLRKTVSAKARKRILAHHTYEIRLQKLIDIMRSTFA